MLKYLNVQTTLTKYGLTMRYMLSETKYKSIKKEMTFSLCIRLQFTFSHTYRWHNENVISFFILLYLVSLNIYRIVSPYLVSVYLFIDNELIWILSTFITYHRICYKRNTTGDTCGTGITYPPGAPEFNLRF
jgi:hypothetical protein